MDLDLERDMNTPYLNQFALHDKARYFYEIGGRWSSKTYSVIQNITMRSSLMPGLLTVKARKVYASIRDSIYQDAKDYLDAIGAKYRAYVSPLQIELWNGSRWIYKGMDKPDKSKGLAGAHQLLLEECNEFTEMDFETMDMSIRGTGYPKKTFLMHNPVPIVPGQMYWFQRLFDPGDLKPGIPKLWESIGLGLVSSMKTTYQHNRYTPEGVKKRLEGYKDTNPELYKLWALGEYAQMQGLIYDNWEVVEKVPDGVNFLGYGLDFGFSGDPAALLAIYGNSDTIYIGGRLYTRGLTNRDLIDKMKALKIGDYDKIVADSAEPKSIEELYRAGFRGIRGVKKRANYKSDIIRVLQGYKIKVLSGDIDLQREISTYSWATDKEEKQLPKPQDGNDHYMDCLSMFWHDHKGNREMSAGGF
jgi:phage terminase large subunit